MNKEIKRKIIVSAISVILGIAILIVSFVFRNIFTEDKVSYVTGFSSGLIVTGMIVFIRTLFAISGTDKGKSYINKLQDERLIAINNEASEITYRITTILTSIVCIVLFLLGFEKEGSVAAIIVGISTFIYLVSYFILSKKK